MRELCLAIYFLTHILYSQNFEITKEYTLKDLEGVWKQFQYDEFLWIIKSNHSLVVDDVSDILNCYLRVYDIGFISKTNADFDTDEFIKDSVKTYGSPSSDYLTIGDGVVQFEGYLTIFSTNFKYYNKVDSLPKGVFKQLYLRGKKDKRDYLEQFLDIEAREARRDRAYIYSAPDTITKMYLIKGDIFKVLSEQDDWIEMEYETDKGRIIRGWLRREDVEGG